MSRSPRRIMLTGANRGLGLSVVRTLAAAGHALTLTARDKTKARDAVRTLHEQTPAAVVTTHVLDLSSLASVRETAAALVERGTPIDVLVHNAGMLYPAPQRVLTDAGVEEALQVHAVAPLLLTRLLLPVLARPSRVWILGSSLHFPGARGPAVDFHMQDPNLDTRYVPERAYKNSKLAALWVAYGLQRRLGAQGVHADVVSPGFVPTTAAAGGRTWFQRAALKYVLPHMSFATSLDESTAGLARLFGQTPLDEPGGRYFQAWAPTPSSEQSRDEAQADAFWRWACEKIGLPPAIV